jgi:S1-C subfamily serine protease
MRWWIGLAFILLFASPALALELPELAARTAPSVVLLTLADASGKKIGSGTGFFVSADGRVITNFHVIQRAASAEATLSDGRSIKILGVLASDRARDIAILKAEGSPFPALDLGDSGLIRPGDEVVVIGSPRGLSGTVSAGIVSAVREKGVAEDNPAPRRRVDDDEDNPETRSWGIQITAAISPGSSGSPIMTRSGDVIAVAVGMRLDGQALNFGVPIQVVKELLGGIDAKAIPKPLAAVAKETSGGREVLTNLGLSAAIFAAIGFVYFAVSRTLSARERRRFR